MTDAKLFYTDRKGGELIDVGEHRLQCGGSDCDAIDNMNES